MCGPVNAPDCAIDTAIVAIMEPSKRPSTTIDALYSAVDSADAVVGTEAGAVLMHRLMQHSLDAAVDAAVDAMVDSAVVAIKATSIYR